MSEEVSENDLRKMLNDRLDEIKESFAELELIEISKVQGINKMRNRLESELKFFSTFETGTKPLELKYLETSNVTHLRNIIRQIKILNKVTAIFNTFTIKDTDGIYEDGDRAVTIKHTVDIVAESGKQWVKVISRSARGILMDWMTGSTRDIFEQADDYLQMAKRFKRNFSPPEVCFIFNSGVPDKMAEKMERKGIKVVGDRVVAQSIVKIPEDFIEMLEEDSDEEESDNEDVLNENEQSADLSTRRTFTTIPMNFDVSAVFVLISNMTHEGGTEHKFASKLLEQQAERERIIPAREELLPKIEGHEWIMCQTAFDSVNTIMKTVSGKTENDRWTLLSKKIHVFEDRVSQRAKKLIESDRINERNSVIFGSGDFYKAVTVTANKHFLASALHQGIPFDSIIHEPRALSEQKERPLDWVPEISKKK